MQVMAPAKINLSLRVLGHRSDGFHEIETFIAPISLCDEIKIEQRSGKQGIAFRCDDPSLPTGDDNIVVRAAKVFFEETNITGGVSIVLKKRIPHGAGLGGGSSDAASTLLALNELFDANLRREALAKMAEMIGSDVPFFIFQSAAVCNGRGELVTPTRLREQLSVLLVKPGFAVLSPWAYSQWRNSREIRGVSYRAQQFTRQRFVNDLERPVFEKFVFLAQLKMWLLKQPEVGAALLSGSGSTVFAVLRSHADADLLAQRAKADLEPELWTYACETR
ncbi:MAG: 4-(cytidine 5'-diphospho)-2-C-methyl-D-erythritol kinase [Candidatus Udaeobacter sp.]